MRRVVITGLGAVTPIGNSVPEFWEGIVAGKVGVAPITAFDTADYKVKVAAQVKGFDAKDYMDFKAAKRMGRFSQFAVAAAGEALQDAGLRTEEEDAYRLGVSIGSGIGGLSVMEEEHAKLLAKGPGRLNPLLVPIMISNMAAGNVSIQYGLKGKSIDIVTACASGTHSIGEGYRSIQHGELDVCLAGGAESAVTPLGIAGFQALTALSTAEDPLRASIPFDKERSGFVLGEGAGVVVLEELEHARRRGAHIYAELAGYGATSDAYHITSPAEDGAGAARAMADAMKEARLTPAEVDYINAHGTATHYNDLFETRAIKAAFGEEAKRLKISSTKSMIGHLLGAAGGVECIVCAKTIQEGYVHRTAGLLTDDPECDLDYVKGQGVFMPVGAAISNSLGFGGHNASLLLKKYSED